MRRGLLFALALLASLMAPVTTSYANGGDPHTHFRYGHYSWRPAGGTSIEFTIQNAFRRNGYSCIDPATLGGVACSSGDGLPGVGDVFREFIGFTQFFPGDGGVIGSPLGPLLYVVTSIDPANNWLFALALDPASLPALDTTISHTYAAPGNYLAFTDSCCRISAVAGVNAHINNPDGPYRVETVVNVDTGNSSPVSAMDPIVLCPIGEVCNLSVPGADPDGDGLNFRLSTSSEAGGGFTQPGPPFAPNAAIVSVSGVYTWDTTGATLGPAGTNTLYSTQVTIEDIDASGSVKSKVALDFLIQLVPCPPEGCEPPEFPPPPPGEPPVCNTTQVVNLGGTLTFTVAASDPNPADTVTLNVAGLPLGATMTPPLPTSGNPVRSDFSWMPAAGDVGVLVVTFAANSPDGSALCPVTIEVSAVPADLDTDGIPDAEDACPNDPEDLDGFADEDGCPDAGDRDPVIIIPGILGTWPGDRFQQLLDSSRVARTLHLLGLLGFKPLQKDFFGDVYADSNTPDWIYYARTYDNWIQSLQREGWDRGEELFVYPYWGLDGMDDSLPRLERLVDEALEASGGTKVDLVGHSQGGLLSRAYVSQVGPEKVDHLVTFGAPHHGAPVAFPIWEGGEVEQWFTGLLSPLLEEPLEQYLQSQAGSESDHDIFHFIRGDENRTAQGTGIGDLLPTDPYLRNRGSSSFRPEPCGDDLTQYPVNIFVCDLFSDGAMQRLDAVRLVAFFGEKQGRLRGLNQTIVGYEITAVPELHAPAPVNHPRRWEHGCARFVPPQDNFCFDRFPLETIFGPGDGRIPSASAQLAARDLQPRGLGQRAIDCRLRGFDHTALAEETESELLFVLRSQATVCPPSAA